MAVPARPVGLLESWAEGWGAALDGMTQCLSAVLTGRATPLDIWRWAEVTAARRPPEWATPHEVVLDSPLARLRDFSVPTSREVVPTLLLPPQAGHDSCIVDYSADQSQMRAILGTGLTRALALDWKPATRATASASISDYLDEVGRAVEHCGGHVNLIGDCQGGWLATIFACLHPDRVNTLTLAGAPVDFHAGEPVIHELLELLAPGGNLGLYEALVAAGGGVLKGDHMLSGFMAIQPRDEISRQLELLLRVRDPAHVARYREFEDWFKHTQDIPGAFYLWIVRHLFRDNELIEDALTVAGKPVHLHRIGMPLNLLAGATDHITPPDQVFAIADVASTPSHLVNRDVTPGGHLGLFMGHQALREHWPPLLAKVLAHSVTD